MASEHPLPQIPFYSIEYPGYVQSSSLPLAVKSLGGQQNLDHAFRRGTTAQKADAFLELSLRPGNPFAHPIPGDIVSTNNLLLKVIKRRRKRRVLPGEPGVSSAAEADGEYTAEVVGIVSKTARFRSMVDFQYFPDMDDPVAKLRMAMENMDVDYLRSYKIPPEPSETAGPSSTPEPVEDEMAMNLDPQLQAASGSQTNPPEQTSQSKKSTLRLFPPPLFSRQNIPQGYNFKANPSSMISTTVDEETGEERKRLINRSRWKGYGPASIMFEDKQVPDKPPQTVQDGRKLVNETLLKKVEALFQERPVWTRMSLFNYITPSESRDVLNSKLLLPLCCYVFQDGPWRDTLVRFSYDPRKDPDSRLQVSDSLFAEPDTHAIFFSYQRIYFRNSNHPISRPSVTTRRNERPTVNEQRGLDTERRAHIFDGQSITKETAAFQLCDITDPMLKAMIEDPDALRETCDDKDGWYTTHAFEQIKTVLRHKFFSLLEGHLVTDDECRALLEANEGSGKTTTTNRTTKPRPGRHNMAKGALRPEDAAAVRLRAALDRNIKSFQSQQRQS